MSNIPLPRLVDSSNHVIRDIHPIRVSITQNIVPLSYVSIELPKSENLPLRGYVEVFSPIGSVGIYRVRTPQDAYGDDFTTSELEHAIADVGDYLVTAKYDEMMAANTAMSTVFGYYTTAAGNNAKWQLGSVSALGSETIALDCDHDKVLEVMLSILEQKQDCMMSFDFSTTPWTVSIVSKGTTVSAEGRLSRNVNSARISYDDSELCTRVYYEIPSTDASGSPITVWTHMDADATSISNYGIVERTVSTDSDYTVAECNQVASAYLAKHKTPKVSVEVSAEELSQITGEAWDTFTIGKLMRLSLPDYNTTIEHNITGLTWDDVYGRPEGVTVQLAEEEDTTITFLHDVDSKGGSSYGGRSGKKEEYKSKYFETLFDRTDKFLEMAAREYGEHGEILRQAGMSIDSHGVLQYADDYEKNVGSMFKVEADKIGMVVGTYDDGRNYIKAGEIALSINNTTGESTATINASHVNISATNTLHTLAGELEVDNDGKLIVKNAGGLYVRKTEQGITSEFGVWNDGNVTAGMIATTVNGEPSTYIQGKNIYIGDTKSTTVISGKCSLSDVDANYIKSKIETVANLNVQAISSASGYQAYAYLNEFKGNYYKVNISGGAGQVTTKDLCDGVYDLQLVNNNNNTYTLQKKGIKDSSWTDVGTFSRAASSLSGSWGGTNNTFPLTVTDGVNNYKIDFTTSGNANVKLMLDTNGSVTKGSGSAVNVPLKIQTYVSGSPPTLTTRYTETINNISVSGLLQSKTVSASNSQNVTVTPDSDKIGLSSVTVSKINSQAKVVSPSLSSQVILPDSGYSYLTSVTINSAQSIYNDGLAAAWINYVPGPPYSKTAQGTIAAGRWVYPGTSGNMWWTAAPWFAYSDTEGSNHQGMLGGHKYIKLVTLDANGAVSDSMYDNATWEIPSGSSDTYTKYTFSKTRTQSSDGYHYTFSISTGWQTPFGASGGTYDLYKKN